MIASEILYIDPDEEIPSIVSRLKLSEASFLIFVIPHRAVLFSSVITMRLFKKEADRLGKDVFVVTQDEQGFDMARRVGFIARKSLDELPFPVEHSGDREYSLGAEESVLVRNESTFPKRNFLQRGGSFSRPEGLKKEYFEKKAVVEEGFKKNSFPDPSYEKRMHEERQRRENENRFLQAELSADKSSLGSSHKVRSVANELASVSDRKFSSMGVSAYGFTPEVSRKEQHFSFEGSKNDREDGHSVKKGNVYDDDAIGSSMWNGEGEWRAKSIFAVNEVAEKDQKRKIAMKVKAEKKLGIHEIVSQKKKPVQGNEKIGSRVQWVVVFSFLIILGMIACIGMYLQGSEADIAVHLKRQNISGDVTYEASEGKSDISIKFLEYEDTMTVSGNATGLGPSSGVKARGTVTLYNAFSKEAQPLVATTRLQTPDGQIFRIVKSVIIPGFSEQNGQMRPGSVKVEAQADEAGEGGNIEPTKFTIPGFSGGPKFEKIYAESEEKMAGGGSGDASNRVISQRDLTDAKKDIEQKVRAAVVEKAKADMSFGITLNDLVDVTFVKETPVPTVGMVAKTFDFSAKIRVRYVVFSDFDARKTAINILKERGMIQQQSTLNENSISLEYGKMSVDFEKKTVAMKMFATGNVSSQLSLDDVRNDLLGKDNAELQSVMEKYPQVESFEVRLEKSYFQNTIPKDPEKVRVTIAGN